MGHHMCGDPLFISSLVSGVLYAGFIYTKKEQLGRKDTFPLARFALLLFLFCLSLLLYCVYQLYQLERYRRNEI